MTIADKIRDAARGIAAVLGDPSPALTLIPSPSHQGAIALVRDGYTPRDYTGRKAEVIRSRVARLDSLLSCIQGPASQPAPPSVRGRGARVALAVGNGFSLNVQARMGSEPQDAQAEARVWCEAHLLDWLSVLGRPLSPAALQQLLRTSGHLLVTPGGQPVTMQRELLAAVASLRLTSATEIETKLGANGQIIAHSASRGVTLDLRIPEWIQLEAAFWPEVTSTDGAGGPILYLLDLILDLDTSNGIQITLRCPGLRSVLDRAEDSACTWMRAALPEATVLVGDRLVESVVVAPL